MSKVFVFMVALFLSVGTYAKADTNKEMPAIISYLLSGDGGVVTENDRYKRVSIDLKDGIVEDKQTGLFWQDEHYTEEENQAYQTKNRGKALEQEKAKTYCENLNYGNYSDWRLPNTYELESIVDRSNHPTLDHIFNPIEPKKFWASEGYTTLFAFVDFNDGKPAVQQSPYKIYYTRCVRGVGKRQILKTGQTVSYGTSDDGSYNKGLERSYARDNAEEIVTDNATKLQWQDNADAKDKTGTLEEAEAYCEDLTLGGRSDWRLPTIVELQSIVDFGKTGSAIDLTFQNVGSNSYWSSVTHILNGTVSDAWYVGFAGDSRHKLKSEKLNIRCVRGSNIDFEKSCTRNSDETVTCPDTKLVWQDNAEVKTKDVGWQDAINYCEQSDFAGHEDWRLPNVNELRGIVDYKKSNYRKIKGGFKNVKNDSDGYWSSTTYVSNKSNAWFVYFRYGVDEYHDKSYRGYVRCVRAGR